MGAQEDKGEGGGTRDWQSWMAWCRISQAAWATLSMCKCKKAAPAGWELDELASYLISPIESRQTGSAEVRQRVAWRTVSGVWQASIPPP